MDNKFPELESYFQKLTDATDSIAAINTHYEADHDRDFQVLEDIFQDIQSREWEKTDNNYYNLWWNVVAPMRDAHEKAKRHEIPPKCHEEAVIIEETFQWNCTNEEHNIKLGENNG